MRRGLYRLFIIIVCFWVVGTTFIVLQVLGDISHQKKIINEKWLNEIKVNTSRLNVLVEKKGLDVLSPDEKKELKVLKNEFSDKKKQYEHKLDVFANKKKETLMIYSFYLIAPIGFIYGTGWIIRWIIRGFSKEE